MIFDTRAIRGKGEIKRIFNHLRKLHIGEEAEYNPAIKLYEPKNVEVLHYFTQPLTLFNRVVSILGFKKNELRTENRKGKSRALVWSIMSSFGHSNTAICRVFGLSEKTGGLSQYYRDKLKYQMRTDPSIVFLYEKAMRILENDIEILEDEIENHERETVTGDRV